MGYSYYKLGNYKKAIEKYLKVLSIDNYNPSVLFQISVCLTLIKDYKNALK